MSYTKTTWKDRIVDNPLTYQFQQNVNGTVTLIPKEGTVTEPGTPVNAANMNNMENVVSTVYDTLNCSTYKSGIDSNGIATEVELKRKDGTLAIKSVLSGGTSPAYTTRTETRYDTDGTTVKETIVYSLSYDGNSNLISEVMQ